MQKTWGPINAQGIDLRLWCANSGKYEMQPQKVRVWETNGYHKFRKIKEEEN
jgi:hypothetical protein